MQAFGLAVKLAVMVPKSPILLLECLFLCHLPNFNLLLMWILGVGKAVEFLPLMLETWPVPGLALAGIWGMIQEKGKWNPL